MSKDKEVVVQVNVKPDGECELDEICLDELLDELKYDDVDEEEEVQLQEQVRYEMHFRNEPDSGMRRKREEPGKGAPWEPLWQAWLWFPTGCRELCWGNRIGLEYEP